jgi:hypothetical protein
VRDAVATGRGGRGRLKERATETAAEASLRRIGALVHRLCAVIILGMSLVGDIAPGHLMSTLWEDQRPVPGRVRGHGLIAAAAMIDGRTPPAVAEDIPGLNSANTEATIPDRETWPILAKPPVVVDRASGNLAAPTEVLGLIDRQGEDVAFDWSGVVADDSLAPLADMTRALGMSLVPFASRVPDARETFAPSSEQDFGIPPALGVGVHIPEGLEIIATPLGVSAFQHMAASGADFFAGITPLGPMAGVDFFQGPVSVRVTGVLSSGQLMSVAALALRTGDVTVTYAVGPGGSSLSGELINGPVDFTFSMAGSELRVNLAWVLEL